MGAHDDYPRKGSPEPRHNLRSKLKILLLLVTTNLFTIYLFKGPFNLDAHSLHLPLFDTHTLLLQLNATQQRLATTESHLTELYQHLHSSNSLLESLLEQIHEIPSVPTTLDTVSNTGARNPLSGWGSDLSAELKLVVDAHKLPLGYSPAFGSEQIYLPLGHACRLLKDDFQRYMDYEVGGECPVDDVFAQQLMLKGCEPLPRRRCRPKSPTNYVEPTPFPASLWSTPPDTSLVWDPYNCKNYQCLIDRKNAKVSADCKDCFDLQGREKHRWLGDNGSLDFGIDVVLGLKKPGTIRIGLDIGGGSGTFAARMRERNVTIVTSSMNFDGPFNSFIASRGLIPMHITVSHRLPFFENTLDIVHSMHVLSNWIPHTMLEFILYDIYRVLRPGGLFWLDHFFCVGDQMNQTYVPIFGRIGFKKLRWIAGRKMDRGIQMNEWYLSALLEKPVT